MYFTTSKWYHTHFISKHLLSPYYVAALPNTENLILHKNSYSPWSLKSSKLMKHYLKDQQGTSLVVQWSRFYTPYTRIQSLVRELRYHIIHSTVRKKNQ